MVAAKIANMPSGNPQFGQSTKLGTAAAVSTADAAAQLSVGAPTVTRARRILRDAPELVPEVEAGRLSINAARAGDGPPR